MNVFEKFKNIYLIFSLDEPFDISFIVSDVQNYFENLNTSESKKKVIDIIKFFIDSKLFQIVEPVNGIDFKRSSLSLDRNLKDIENSLINRTYLDNCHYIDLTTLGIEEAKKYLLKETRAKEKIILNKKINLINVAKIIKDEFKINNFQEIEYEINEIISNLIFNRFLLVQIQPNLFEVPECVGDRDCFVQLEKALNTFQVNQNIGENVCFIYYVSYRNYN